MPRKARIDAPGALHHIIMRGIERKVIFIVKDLKALKTYPYSGHGVIMGKLKNDWQHVDYILKMFGQKVGYARRSYADFVAKGIDLGRRPDLTGGGLIRSGGGWSALKALRS